MKNFFSVIGLIATLLLGAVLLGGAVLTVEQYRQGVLIDDDLVTGSVALSGTSAQYTLPKIRDPYLICAIGNAAYVECGSAPVVTTSAGGYTFVIPEGTCLGPFRLKGPKCAHIAASATGQIIFIHHDASL